MKTLKKIIFSVVATASMGLMTGCQTDFDKHVPGFDIPVATLTANTTILELKQRFWEDPVNYVWQDKDKEEVNPYDPIPVKDDGSHYIIKGRVISSDRTGNVYKKLVIADETAALAISVNAYSLYLTYRPGQEVVIDATGMYIGKYNGTEQLGYPMFYEKGQVWETTFMSKMMLEEHIELNGLPEPEKIDTLVIRKFSDLPSAPAELAAFQSRLVRFNNVHFAEGGEAKFVTAYKENTNRILYDADNQSITVRTSGYATFRDEMLPEGNGDVVALLDYYATSDNPDAPWQLTLIDAQGCMNFGNPTMQPGDETNPYTVEQAIQTIDAGKTDRGWVTGYIVGAVAPEVTTVSSNNDIEWSAEVVLANTIVIADNADCKDYTKCMIVPLPQDTPLRQLGNLRDNPGNYGKQIRLFGSLDTYMGSWGLTGNSGATSQFRIDGVEVPGGEIAQGSGTEESPYNVGQIVAMNPTSTTESPAGGSGVWVKGYIVGSMPTGGSSTTLSGTNFSTADAATTNIVVGPTADCTDYTKCIGIQLPTGAVRSALNLADNAGNLGKEVSLYGDVMKYCGGPGLKNTSKYVLGEGGGDVPTPPTPPAAGDGTKDSPYDCATIIALNPSSTQEAVAGYEDIWVEGYIVGSMPTGGSSTLLSNTEFSTNNAATTNMVIGPTADCTDASKCIGIQLPSGANRTALNLADNPGNLGKKVKLNGAVMKYCGGPGLKNLKGYEWVDGSGDTPTPPAPSTATTIYSALGENDANITAGWTLNVDATLSGDLTYIWQWKEYNSSHYLNGSGYLGSAQAAEALAVSGTIDLTGATDCTLAFDHAAKFQTTLRTLCGVMVREAGSTNWTSLTIPTWPDAGSWGWANSGEISLAAFNGKKIEIAFKYQSTTSGADTWEIKNLVVKGKK